jgi:hypothetical protein
LTATRHFENLAREKTAGLQTFRRTSRERSKPPAAARATVPATCAIDRTSANALESSPARASEPKTSRAARDAPPFERDRNATEAKQSSQRTTSRRCARRSLASRSSRARDSTRDAPLTGTTASRRPGRVPRAARPRRAGRPSKVRAIRERTRRATFKFLFQTNRQNATTDRLVIFLVAGAARDCGAADAPCFPEEHDCAVRDADGFTTYRDDLDAMIGVRSDPPPPVVSSRRSREILFPSVVQRSVDRSVPPRRR